MFNGIIEVVGRITSVVPGTGGGALLVFDAGRYATRLKRGDSIAVDGVCLTAVRKSGKNVTVDISAETWTLTNLSSRQARERVNLEMPVTGSTLISGHFVQGHVEGVARVKAWKRIGDDVRISVVLPSHVTEYCVPKGSIAMNGVSLTIASLKGRTVEVALIPYTLQHTNLGDLKPGDAVNIETDMIGRYVVSVMKKTYDK